MAPRAESVTYRFICLSKARPFARPIAAVPGKRVAAPVARSNRQTPFAAGFADCTAP